MATVHTINTLTAKIRQRADQIGSTTFDDTSELKLWIRASLVQLQEMLCQEDEEWYTNTVPLTLHAGIEAYSMPSDMRRLNSVYALYAFGANRQRLQQFDKEDYGALNYPSLAGKPLMYRLYRNLLYIQPTPTADIFNALEIVYTPERRHPVLDYTQIDDMLPSGADEWVVLDVLQKMSVKTRLQNMDDILKSKAQQEARLRKLLRTRSDVAPRMRDAWRTSQQPMGYSAPQGPLVWVTA